MISCGMQTPCTTGPTWPCVLPPCDMLMEACKAKNNQRLQPDSIYDLAAKSANLVLLSASLFDAQQNQNSDLCFISIVTAVHTKHGIITLDGQKPHNRHNAVDENSNYGIEKFSFAT